MIGQKVLGAVADALEAEREELARLDNSCGDGDFGETAAGIAAVLRAVAGTGATGANLVRECGDRIMRRVPSTGGTLVALGTLAGARVLEGTTLSGLRAVARAVAEGTAEIARRGRAELGGRSMLDALWPAVRSLEMADKEGWGIATALRCAAAAADEGARGTAALLPKVGRARWLRERALGHEDPGARAIAIAFSAAAEAVGSVTQESGQ